MYRKITDQNGLHDIINIYTFMTLVSDSI